MTHCCAPLRRWPADQVSAPSPRGAAALAGLESAIERGLANRLETIVLLVTGREVKAVGAPTDPGRVNLVETLDEVERVLADDS